MTTIAVRLKNPLNIRPLPGGNTWKGQIGVENTASGKFCVFEDMAWGLRAAIVNLGTYKRKYGIDTIEKVISRWAPVDDPHGNHTRAYIGRVVKLTGISATMRIDLQDPEILNSLLAAMHRVEAGLSDSETLAYSAANFYVALGRAGLEPPETPSETPTETKPAPPTPAPVESRSLLQRLLAFLVGLFRRN